MDFESSVKSPLGPLAGATNVTAAPSTGRLLPSRTRTISCFAAICCATFLAPSPSTTTIRNSACAVACAMDGCAKPAYKTTISHRTASGSRKRGVIEEKAVDQRLFVTVQLVPVYFQAKCHRILAVNFAFELALCSHSRDQRYNFRSTDAAVPGCAYHFRRMRDDVFFDPGRVDHRCVDRCKSAQVSFVEQKAQNDERENHEYGRRDH